MTKLLMLDLDGTIRQCKSNPGEFINDPLDQKLIPGVTKAIARYSDWEIVGITNQSGVASGGRYSEAAMRGNIGDFAAFRN